MDISFFEEFPNEKNLEKLKLINFPSLVYIAARSFEEFNEVKEKALRLNSNIEIGYWPILKKSYYVSPFSYSEELKELYNSLENHKTKKPLEVLLDLELPFSSSKLFFRNLAHFRKNKKLIRKIFEDSEKLNIKISTAEYPVSGRIFGGLLKVAGISYSTNKFPHKKIIMFYSSMLKNNFLFKAMERTVVKQARKLGDNLKVGLGTIAVGILGDEPILKPDELDKDLFFCRENGINSAIIFRLGGLNKTYLKVIEKYL